MDDLDKYIQKRKENDKEFAKNFDIRYEDFKIGEMLKYASTKNTISLKNTRITNEK